MFGVAMGGCSCHCDMPATLWKIRLSDGQVVWKALRTPSDATSLPNASIDVDVFDDGVNRFVYEAGPAPGLGGTQSITKWVDLGESRERDWDTDSIQDLEVLGANTVRRLRVGTDGILWQATTRKLTFMHPDQFWLSRYSPETGELLIERQIRSKNQEFFHVRNLHQAPDGKMFATYGESSTSSADYPIRYDSDVVEDAKIDDSGPFSFAHPFTTYTTLSIAPVDNDSLNGFVAAGQLASGFGLKYARWTADLSSYTAIGNAPIVAPLLGQIDVRVVENCAAHGRVLCADSRAVRMVKTSDCTIDWEVGLPSNISFTGALPRHLGGIDASRAGYLMPTQGSFTIPIKLRKFAAGALEWTYEPESDDDIVSRLDIDDANGLVILSGAIQVSGEVCHVVALSQDDGSVVWSRQLGAAGSGDFGFAFRVRNTRMFGEHIYVCGDKM